MSSVRTAIGLWSTKDFPDESRNMCGMLRAHGCKDRRENTVLSDPAVEFCDKGVQRFFTANPFEKCWCRFYFHVS